MATNHETSNESPGKKLVGAEYIGKRLGVHHITVRRMAETRMIPSVRISGGLLRFDEDEVMEAIRRNGSIPDVGKTGTAPRPIFQVKDDEGDERSQLLKQLLAEMAGALTPDEARGVSYQIPDILACAERAGVAGMITLGNASPSRSMGKALAKLRGRLLKDDKGRTFELLREVTKAATLYHFRF